jgi:RNA polymerase sigma factor (sigma-70 family)
MRLGDGGQAREPDICKNAPQYLRALSARSGDEWTPDEIQQMMRWWYEPPQQRRVLQYAVLFLGAGVTLPDVEDAVASFYELFEAARKSYQPGAICFCSYLITTCFKNHCVRMGRVLRYRHVREKALAFTSASGEDVELKLHDSDPDHQGYEAAQRQAFLADLSEWLNSSDLSPVHREVFILRYFHEMTYDEIADTLQRPVGSVKAWLHRVHLKARKHLRKRGWSE